VFAYEKGAPLVGGGTAAARRVAFLVDPDSLFGITPDGRDTLRAAIRWAVDPAAADPATPTGLTVTPGASSVQVAWSAVAGASAYVVLRETLSDLTTLRTGSIAEALARVTGTSYTDTAPVAGVPYAYRVVAVNSSGSSALSGALYAGISAPPQRPEIAAVALAASARLDIKPVGGATSLRVLRATESAGPYTTVASNLPPSTATYTVTGLTNDVPAYFVVEGVNATGFTRSLQAYAIPHAAFTAPAGLTATASAGRVALAWSAVANARGYSVGRAVAGGGSATEIVTPYTSAASLTDVNVPNGKAFTYFVTALGDAETKGPAATVAATAKGKALLVRAATASAGDVVLKNRLVALGFDVIEKADTALVSGDAAGNDLVVVTETVTSGNVNTKLTSVATPVLCLEPSILDDLKMTGTANGTDYGTLGGQTQINVVDGTHPLAAGLTGVRAVNTTGGVYSWGVPNANAVVVGTLTSSATRATVFGYQVGFPMYSGLAPARRVGLFVDSPTATSFTADGAALYDAAVRWTAGLK
jgi:fibronectin type 3 domain-containing protein